MSVVRDVAACGTCRRPFAQGELAWASDWKVFDGGRWVLVTRYTCDDCEALTAK